MPTKWDNVIGKRITDIEISNNHRRTEIRIHLDPENDGASLLKFGISAFGPDVEGTEVEYAIRKGKTEIWFLD
jgi:hypothetical protein